MKRIKAVWRPLLERAVRTFIQGFVAGLAGASLLGTDAAALKGVLIGGIASGLSAVMSFVATFIGDPSTVSFTK